MWRSKECFIEGVVLQRKRDLKNRLSKVSHILRDSTFRVLDEMSLAAFQHKDLGKSNLNEAWTASTSL